MWAAVVVLGVLLIGAVLDAQEPSETAAPSPSPTHSFPSYTDLSPTDEYTDDGNDDLIGYEEPCMQAGALAQSDRAVSAMNRGQAMMEMYDINGAANQLDVVASAYLRMSLMVQNDDEMTEHLLSASNAYRDAATDLRALNLQSALVNMRLGVRSVDRATARLETQDYATC